MARTAFKNNHIGYGSSTFAYARALCHSEGYWDQSDQEDQHLRLHASSGSLPLSINKLLGMLFSEILVTGSANPLILALGYSLLQRRRQCNDVQSTL